MSYLEKKGSFPPSDDRVTPFSQTLNFDLRRSQPILIPQTVHILLKTGLRFAANDHSDTTKPFPKKKVLALQQKVRH
jgi:hypothetical protein